MLGTSLGQSLIISIANWYLSAKRPSAYAKRLLSYYYEKISKIKFKLKPFHVKLASSVGMFFKALLGHFKAEYIYRMTNILLSFGCSLLTFDCW